MDRRRGPRGAWGRRVGKSRVPQARPGRSGAWRWNGQKKRETREGGRGGTWHAMRTEVARLSTPLTNNERSESGELLRESSAQVELVQTHRENAEKASEP